MNKPEIKASNATHSWIARRKTLTLKSINVSRKGLINTGFLKSGQPLPLVVQPKLEGVDLFVWAKNNLEFIEKSLLRYGGILFRGFDISTKDRFEEFLKAVSLQLMPYIEGATPRTELGERVYTSTEYPSDQSIAVHNELNYVITWPMNIFFCCFQAAEWGGETPIVDVRKVYDRISPEILAPFAAKGWMLVRNFGDGLSLPWQTAFRTTGRSELENYCRNARLEFEWKDDNHLRTRQIRPAIRRHPKTGEAVWFNHMAFWHVSSLEPHVREVFLTELGQENLPYNTYYGDGSPIEDSVVEEIRNAYRQETVAFPWEKGDLLMMDNMLVAHGRNPFSGARKIVVAMGNPFSDM